MITTVLGEIPASELGITSAHEHMYIDMRGCVDVTGNEPLSFRQPVTAETRYLTFSEPYAVLDNALLSDETDAANELLLFKQAGGKTVVDCTLDEIGRDPLKLKRLSEKTGVQIVMGCGHYYHKAHFPYVKDTDVETLANELRRDILVGVGDTGVKAGVIGEIGTSAVMSPSERKVLQAAGIVGAETGKGVHVHTDLYTENGLEVIEILTREGMKAEKICIDHVDVWLRPDYIRALLDKGAFVEFDNFGKEFYVSESRRFAYDLERVKLLATLLNEGYGKQILLSNDICLKTMWCRYGGNGYAHILQTVRKMAYENGISENAYDALLSENVKNFLR